VPTGLEKPIVVAPAQKLAAYTRPTIDPRDRGGVAIDNGAQRYHGDRVAFSERVQRALVAAASLLLGEQ